MIRLFAPVLLLVVCSTAWADDFVNRAEVQEYIADLQAQHGFDPDSVQALFSTANRRDDIIEKIKNN